MNSNDRTREKEAHKYHIISPRTHSLRRKEITPFTIHSIKIIITNHTPLTKKKRCSMGQ